MGASVLGKDSLTRRPESYSATRVLVVDDEEEVRLTLARILGGMGYAPVIASDAFAALQEIREGGASVVVSDIVMPGMDGIAFVRAIRDQDLNIPVIFLTGSPSLETAREAVEVGAFRYLVKPVYKAELETAVARAVGSHRLAVLKRKAFELTGRGNWEPDQEASLEARFERAVSALWIAYQPIVRVSDGSIFGYEALMRSEEPSLPDPAAILNAAERLDRLARLGRVVRVRAALPMSGAPKDLTFFVNLHPAELLDEDLLSPDAPMSAMADRIYLEITERAALRSVWEVRGRVAELRKAGYRIAIDDLGAGYAGLTSFATLEPDIVKLDMDLTRDSDTSPLKRKLIQAICNVCADQGIAVVAEGIETAAERETVSALGCDFLQGYFLAEPGRGFPAVRVSCQV